MILDDLLYIYCRWSIAIVEYCRRSIVFFCVCDWRIKYRTRQLISIWNYTFIDKFFSLNIYVWYIRMHYIIYVWYIGKCILYIYIICIRPYVTLDSSPMFDLRLERPLQWSAPAGRSPVQAHGPMRMAYVQSENAMPSVSDLSGYITLSRIYIYIKYIHIYIKYIHIHTYIYICTIIYAYIHGMYFSLGMCDLNSWWLPFHQHLPGPAASRIPPFVQVWLAGNVNPGWINHGL